MRLVGLLFGVTLGIDRLKQSAILLHSSRSRRSGLDNDDTERIISFSTDKLNHYQGIGFWGTVLKLRDGPVLSS